MNKITRQMYTRKYFLRAERRAGKQRGGLEGRVDHILRILRFPPNASARLRDTTGIKQYETHP